MLSSAVVLGLGASQAHAQHGHGGHVGHAGGFHAGGYHAGGYHAGGYHVGGYHAGGVRPAGYYGAYHAGYRGYPSAYGAYRGAYYGAYRPYYGGYGLYGSYRSFYRPYYAGLYLPYYGYYSSYYPDLYSPYYGYGIGAFAAYAPYYGGMSLPAYPLLAAGDAAYAPPATVTQPAPSQTDRPPADNAFHLQLTVPANAEVIIDGAKTQETGTTREYVSPALNPGTRYSYKLTVRYTNAAGTPVEDTRDIAFQANDWFSIDFTRPAPRPTAPLPQAAPPAKGP